jgi:cytochrome b
MTHDSSAPLWDLPVRVFHWGLAAAFALAWWSAEYGEMDWHRRAGYAIAGLVLFRLGWGLLGSSTARFGSFVRGPGTVIRYVRGDMMSRTASGEHTGHNPLGGWSVVLMLLLLTLQVGLGLFAVDIDGLESGPFSYLIEFDTSRQAAELHELVFNVLLAVVALHLLAVLFHQVWKRENLVGPMITGGRGGAGPNQPVRAVLLGLAVAAVLWVAIGWYGQV